MPLLPGLMQNSALIMGLTEQNFNLLMGISGIVCAGLVMLIWGRSL